MVTLRYWAGVRAAAGVSEDQVQAITLADALAAARGARPGNVRFDRILAVCSFLLEDTPVSSREPASVLLTAGVTVDVLPPFAGG